MALGKDDSYEGSRPTFRALALVALGAAAVTSVACGSTTRRLYGPGPEYEDPIVPPAPSASSAPAPVAAPSSAPVAPVVVDAGSSDGGRLQRS